MKKSTRKSVSLSLSLLLLLLTPFLVHGQDNLHYENIFSTGDACRYIVPDHDIGTTWIETGFDDAGWLEGITGIGYNDDDDNTIIESGAYSVYIRQEFTVADQEIIKLLVLDMDYDDGFVAYLNGSEVARANVVDPISWNMELGIDHEAGMYSGGRPERYIISESEIQSLLTTGVNVLAVEVHNVGPGSSDLSSNIFLHAYIDSGETIYREVPEWFWEPVSYSDFNLPLMVINTNGQTIVDDPRIVADMNLIWNGVGSVNNSTDPPNEYSGRISIEIRGESSQQFEKKSYSIELQNADGTNNNVSILGLPPENDFILNGPYSDKTMIRNVLTYHLYNRMGSWAPRTRYIELLINDDYRGVYILMEKVKRDDNRVDIRSLTPEDVTEADISGGYILRRDKTTGLNSYEYWTSPVEQIYFEQMVYQYFDPKYEELTEQQRQYIKNWMEEFDEMMSGSSFADRETGYWSFVEVGSFVDMIILNELSKEIDAYMFSTYFYKNNIRDGGKLVAGPPWDYNLSYGSVDYGFGENVPYYYDWVYNHWGRVYWYNRLMEDPVFENKVFCRWELLRSSYLADEYVEYMIDSCVSFMGEAVERNFNRYPILGVYVWPNRYIPETYGEEITNLRTWVLNRLDWIDTQWYGQCITNPVSHELISYTDAQFKVYPNPSDFRNIHIYVDLLSDELLISLELYDINGRLIEQIIEVSPKQGQYHFEFADHSALPDGIYVCRIVGDSGILFITSLVKTSNR